MTVVVCAKSLPGQTWDTGSVCPVHVPYNVRRGSVGTVHSSSVIFTVPVVRACSALAAAAVPGTICCGLTTWPFCNGILNEAWLPTTHGLGVHAGTGAVCGG